MNIKKVDYADDLYMKENTSKNWICLHHTCSLDPQQDIEYWKSQANKVCTPYIVARDGTIYNLFDDKYWSYHLGLKAADGFDHNKNIKYNSETIGIEISNLGELTQKQVDSGKFKFETKDYRGQKYWQTYTSEQYQAISELIKWIISKYPNIKTTFIQTEDFNQSVFDNSCIFSHRNVHREKTDVSPAFDFRKLEQLVKS